VCYLDCAQRELDEYLRVAEEKEHETRQWISESETVQLGVDDLVVPADALSAQYYSPPSTTTSSSSSSAPVLRPRLGSCGGSALSLSPHRMMELVAEDAGIEDTLYYMDKALHSNTIDLQTHLKAHHSPPPIELCQRPLLLTLPPPFFPCAQLTRNLCREQFQKRALAMRVHELQKQRM
jgi:hypothetical protein